MASKRTKRNLDRKGGFVTKLPQSVSGRNYFLLCSGEYEVACILACFH